MTCLSLSLSRGMFKEEGVMDIKLLLYSKRVFLRDVYFSSCDCVAKMSSHTEETDQTLL